MNAEAQRGRQNARSRGKGGEGTVEIVKEMEGWNVLYRHLDTSHAALPDVRRARRTVRLGGAGQGESWKD